MRNLFFILFTLSISAISIGAAPSHSGWSTLLKKNVSEKGRVNYKGFIADSVALNDYLRLLSTNAPQDSWTQNEKMAFWINAYNAFTVKLVTVYYPVKSIKDIGSKVQIPFVNTPWDIKFIKIGDAVLDLNKIEHEQLRKTYGDPRVHFALVCASKSCPILLNTAYTAEKLDEQLDQQARVFLSDKTRNDVSENKPKLSKLFDWYAMDFKTKDRSVIDFINIYAPVQISPDAKLTYFVYDWNLNE